MMNEWILSSTLLIAAVVILRAALRGKISLRLRYALWVLVLVRLLIPVQLFTSDFGVGSMAQDVDLTAPVRQVYNSVTSSEAFLEEYEAVYRQIATEYAAKDQQIPADRIDKEVSTRVMENRVLDVSRGMSGLWLGGMAVLAMTLIVCNGRFALRLRRSRREVAVNMLLPVYESVLVPTPCIFGVFSPAIYLTPEVAGDEKARTHVLAHELTHYRHWDHVWSVLRCVCLVLHWYNPLVWLAFRLSREDAELACDEGALETLGEEARSDYGRTLIRLTCGEKLSTGLIAATTMTGSARSIARRLKTLTRRRRTTVLAVIAVIVACVIAVGCTFSGAPETNDPGESKPAESDPAVESAPAGELPLTVDGVIVYPGTQWNMTPDQVKAALGLKEEHCETYVDETLSDHYAVYVFGAEDQTLLGVPVTLRFEFRAHTSELKLGLCLVDVIFGKEDDLYTARELLWERLGTPDEMTSGVLSEIWSSDAVLSDFADRNFWMEQTEYGNGDAPAAKLFLSGPGTGGEPNLVFSSDLVWLQLAEQGHTPDNDMSDHSQQIPIPDFTEPPEGALTPEEIDQVNEAFAPVIPDESDPNGVVGNPIACFFNCYFGDVREIDLDALLRYCSISEPATEEEFQMLTKLEDFPYTGTMADMPVPLHRYRAEDVDALLKQYTGLGLRDRYEREEFWPGLYYLVETNCYYNTTSDAGFGMFHCIGGQTYDGGVVELYSNQSVLTLRQEGDRYYIHSHRKLEPGTALTGEQVQQVRDAFAIVGADGELNPLASLVNQYYTSAELMDLEALIAYFPVDGEGTGEEYALFQAKYPDEFPEWPTLDECPLPMHRYNASSIDGVLRRYANITLDDLADRTGYYLEETDCYYNFTSDMGLRGFYCTSGTVYADGAVLYSDHSVLGLKMLGDQYVIDYHLPLGDEE